MKYLARLMISAIIVMIISKFLSGVYVDTMITSALVAFILSFLNTFLRPILIFFTFPFTIFTFGLFLLVINAIIIIICDKILDGFEVKSFLTALIFSILVSISQSILYNITNLNKNN